MGITAKEIFSVFTEHLSKVSDEHRKIRQRLNSVSTFSPARELAFGDFKIMPVVIDHSAFDAYAFRIESGGVKVFHSGDFRMHGFRSKKISKVIENFIGPVDFVVCEATNVNSSKATALPEYELQRKFEAVFRENKYNVIYLSSINIDRLFAIYHAALRAHRPFYIDAYQKNIMDIVAGRDGIWGKSRLYNYSEKIKPIVLLRGRDGFIVNESYKDFLADRGYVLIARASDSFDKLIAQIPSEGRKSILSMWDGYVNETKDGYNPMLAKPLGKDFVCLHTSGHCDMSSLEALLSELRPKGVIPIHTDNPIAFAKRFNDRWPVILLNDGETFSPA